MKHYHIWTIGCQMNEADSGRVAAELDALGYAPTDNATNADVIVLNTCVVRQSAEDRAVGPSLVAQTAQGARPDRVIALMGCMVGVKPNPALRPALPIRGCLHAAVRPGAIGGVSVTVERLRSGRG